MFRPHTDIRNYSANSVATLGFYEEIAEGSQVRHMRTFTIVRPQGISTMSMGNKTNNIIYFIKITHPDFMNITV